MKLWNAAAGKIERTLDGYPSSPIGVAFSPDSRQLAVVTERQTQIRQMQTWEVLREFEPREDFTFTAVAYSPDGKSLALANLLDVSLWDLAGTP